MATNSQTFDFEEKVAARRTTLDRLLWPILIALAWLAFEVTANATLSLVLACLKFGMNDFRTAWWLWRRDPQRPRARACASFYATSGVWKTTVVPLLTMVSIAIVWAMVAPRALRNQHPISEQLVLSLKVGMCAAVVLVVLAACSTILSLLARWRVWVHANVHRSRKADCWPPQFLASEVGKPNYAFLIMITAVFVMVIVGPVLTVLTVNAWFDPPPAFRRAIALLVVFGYPIVGGTGFSILRRRLFARSPWECWPESVRNLDMPADVKRTDSFAAESIKATF